MTPKLKYTKKIRFERSDLKIHFSMFLHSYKVVNLIKSCMRNWREIFIDQELKIVVSKQWTIFDKIIIKHSKSQTNNFILLKCFSAVFFYFLTMLRSEYDKWFPLTIVTIWYFQNKIWKLKSMKMLSITCLSFLKYLNIK